MVMNADEFSSFRVQLPAPWVTDIERPDSAHPAEETIYSHVAFKVCRAFLWCRWDGTSALQSYISDQLRKTCTEQRTTSR